MVHLQDGTQAVITRTDRSSKLDYLPAGNNDDSLRTLGKCSTSAAAYQTSHLFKGEIIAISYAVSCLIVTNMRLPSRSSFQFMVNIQCFGTLIGECVSSILEGIKTLLKGLSSRPCIKYPSQLGSVKLIKLAFLVSVFIFNFRKNTMRQNNLRNHSYLTKINSHISRVRRIKKSRLHWLKRVQSIEYRVCSIRLFSLIFLTFLWYLILSLSDKKKQ